MKKIIFVIFIVMMLAGCGKQEYTTSYLDVFDTFSTLTMYTSSRDEFDSISDELHTELVKLNKLFDIYNDYEGINNIKTINDNAGIAPVTVDNEIIDLIKAGIDAYDKTDGTVNIAMGSVLKIWHSYRENALDNNIYAVPASEELEEAAKHTDINSIIIDEDNSTVFITDENTSLDVGAIAKGYTADYAAEFLREKNVGSALLNLGGNVICLNDSTKESWTIGVTSPENPQEYIDKITIKNKSAVSSGNYQRYYEYNGKRYHHIIDSKTLYPAENNSGVTIISDSSLEGDIFSTALFILPYEDGKKLAEENGFEALWVTTEGNVYKTENFDNN